MGTLILVRHGQSQWNLENRFTGWTDVSLTPAGRADAVLTGKSLRDYRFDIAFTSALKRAHETLDALLEGHGQTGLLRIEDKALNERHYGDLQGLNKAETIQKFGEEQVKLWRRSFSTRPPNGESIEDCVARVMPYFNDKILPELVAGKTVLVVAHGNSLRPIFRDLDHLSDDVTATLEVPLVVPTVYTFDGTKPIKKEIITVEGMVVKDTSKITK
ncbi:MAG: 2,3-bisphosphoglycerate-dependent phosphoglycerate mutase [Candidatus Peribacteraceae bacterium]